MNQTPTSADMAQSPVLSAAFPLSTEGGNKLIAEFMGYKYFQSFYGGWGFCKDEKDMSTWLHSNNIIYHYSWDWLMPVVEKIESMGYTFKICLRRVEIDVDGEHPPYPMILCEEETKILSAWKACIEFIRVCPKGSR